jgi:hypothetical protein
MKIRVTADLGALGAKAGPAIAYQWSPPSRLPQFLPGLALLLLLLPKRNRCLQALWIGAPLAVSLAIASALVAMLGMEGEALEGNLGILIGLTFGLAAVWLLSPYLKGRSRWRTFLRMLAAMESFALVSFLIGHYGDRESGPAEMLIGVAVFALLLSLVLGLAGWSCRRRFDWPRLLLWLIFWIMAALLVVFGVMSVLEGPGPLLEMATALAIATAVSLGLLLPFLLLSFANAFYHERLKELLQQ